MVVSLKGYKVELKRLLNLELNHFIIAMDGNKFFMWYLVP